MPTDPLGSVAVNPTWPPPRSDAAQSRRPWWLPLVVVAVVALLIATTTYVANSTVIFGRAATAAQYLPPDGAVAFERTDTTRELKTTIGTMVTESARFSGVAALLSVDSRLSAAMGKEAFDEKGDDQGLADHHDSAQRSGSPRPDHPVLPCHSRGRPAGRKHADRGVRLQPRIDLAASRRPRRQPLE